MKLNFWKVLSLLFLSMVNMNELQAHPIKVLSQDEIENLRHQFKINLSSFYSAELAFFADYGRYTTDLLSTGWSPSTAKPAFKLGFLNPSQSVPGVSNETLTEDPTRMDVDDLLTIPSEANRKIDLRQFSHLCKQGCTADKKGFEVLLVAYFEGHPGVEIWSINEKKVLQHLKDGTQK